jgi:hypothetical protein
MGAKEIQARALVRERRLKRASISQRLGYRRNPSIILSFSPPSSPSSSPAYASIILKRPRLNVEVWWLGRVVPFA